VGVHEHEHSASMDVATQLPSAPGGFLTFQSRLLIKIQDRIMSKTERLTYIVVREY